MSAVALMAEGQSTDQNDLSAASSRWTIRLAGKIEAGVALLVVTSTIAIAASFFVLPTIQRTLSGLTEQALPSLSSMIQLDRALDDLTLAVTNLASSEDLQDKRSAEREINQAQQSVEDILGVLEAGSSDQSLSSLYAVSSSIILRLADDLEIYLGLQEQVKRSDQRIEEVKTQLLARSHTPLSNGGSDADVDRDLLAWKAAALALIDDARRLHTFDRRYDLVTALPGLEAGLTKLATGALSLDQTGAGGLLPITASLTELIIGPTGLHPSLDQVLVQKGRITGLSNEASTLISEFYFAGRNRLEQYQETADGNAAQLGSAYADLQTVLVIALAAILSIAAAVSFYLRRNVSSRLSRLNSDITERSIELMTKQEGEATAIDRIAGDEISTISASVDYFLSEIKKQTKQLVVARDAAESATEAKSMFLASMSHEIRTPMNGVIGMVDLLKQTELNSEQKQMLQTVQDSGQSLLTIINDILDFSKIEAGKLELESIEMSVLDIVEAVAQTLAPNAVKKGFNITTFVDPRIPAFVMGDPVRVRQILINLGGNAIKFSEFDNIVISADLMSYPGDQNAVIKFSVTDKGIGISEEAQANLFQEFSQADSSTTRTHGGTGLGLAICKRLAEMMRGQIGVKSTLGEGSTFHATLPFVATERQADYEKVEDLSGLRVLVVSTDAQQREICRTYLQYWNAEIEVSARLETCLERVVDAEQRGEPIEIVAIPDWDPPEDVIDTKAAFAESGRAVSPTFVVGHDPRVPVEELKSDPNLTLVDINPLRRAGFLTAIAVAAGRASPETFTEEEVQDLKARRLPSRRDAEDMGRLVLVVDDNPVNRDVIQRQLNMLGYQCDVAENGKEALLMAEHTAYGIILTDCHMPEMDGYELTDALRRREAGTDKRQPIVAVTANALQGEADRCLAAGMDDYMSKPIEMRVLKTTLLKWLGAEPEVEFEPELEPEAQVAHPEQMEQIEPGEEVGGAFDEQALKDLFGDDPEMIGEVLSKFVVSTEEIMGELSAALSAEDGEAVRDAAHKLKSSARTIGAHLLGMTCEYLEDAGQEADWDEISDLAPQLTEQFGAVKAQIEAM